MIKFISTILLSGKIIFYYIIESEIFSDSLYMALSAESLEELIKPELREEWGTVKQTWFPREDAEHSLYDKRTPGKFIVCYCILSIISKYTKNLAIIGYSSTVP